LLTLIFFTITSKEKETTLTDFKTEVLETVRDCDNNGDENSDFFFELPFVHDEIMGNGNCADDAKAETKSTASSGF
jgi:hypothetical protein